MQQDIRTYLIQRISIDDFTDCWNWTEYKAKNGYGRVVFEGKQWYAHRLSHKVFNKEIEDGLCICHSCDNPSCINPSHLWTGSHKDNMDDMFNKGRKRKSRAKLFMGPKIKGQRRGANHPNSKFSENQAFEILRLIKNGEKGRIIAKKFNVDESTISHIKRGKRWKHLQDLKSNV